MAILETSRHKIPLLAAGQAHKELFHNEALARIDLLIHPVVQSIETDPTSIMPSSGQAWLVGTGAIDEWLGHDHEIAGWSGSGWLFIAPQPHMQAYVESIGCMAVFRGSWQIVPAIANPAGGPVVDAEARTAIDSILAALRAQGVLDSGT